MQDKIPQQWRDKVFSQTLSVAALELLVVSENLDGFFKL